MPNRKSIPVLSSAFIRSNLQNRNKGYHAHIVIQDVPSEKRILGLFIFSILFICGILFGWNHYACPKIFYLEEKHQTTELENYVLKDNDLTTTKPFYERCNYAAESLGGEILSVGDTQTFITKQISPMEQIFLDMFCLFGDFTMFAHRILQPSTQPGDCWAFKGQRGFAIIKLYDKIFLDSIAIEHIPINISPNNDISSAPKEFTILGLSDSSDETGFNFGNFTYDINLDPVQLFNFKKMSSIPFDLIKFVIKSNWGNNDYTCVYKINVYGEIKNN